MLKIYHNNRCSKSRGGLQLLKDKGLEFEIVEYLKNPLTEEELNKLLNKLNLKPFELVRTQEAIYKEQFKGRDFADHEWVKIICENPKLLKRPIIETDYKAIWAVPAEELEKIV